MHAGRIALTGTTKGRRMSAGVWTLIAYRRRRPCCACTRTSGPSPARMRPPPPFFRRHPTSTSREASDTLALPPRSERSRCVARCDRSLAAILLLFAGHAAASPADLRATAHEYYQWRDAAYPVATSDQGDHRYDNRLADYRMSEVVRRREHVSDLLTKVGALSTEGWGKDDRIDRILFQSQLAGADFFGRQLDPESSDPQVYVNECTNAIFSLLKKDYASPRTRGLAATARLRADARTAAAGAHESHAAGEAVRLTGHRGSARGRRAVHGSLMTLAEGMSPAERKRLETARDGGNQGVARLCRLVTSRSTQDAGLDSPWARQSTTTCSSTYCCCRSTRMTSRISERWSSRVTAHWKRC